MPVDLVAAEQFVLTNARVLDRHRLAVLLDGASPELVLTALRAYANPDGGFGHALEPDVRGPESQPASTVRALEVLIEIGATDDPLVAGAAAWVESIANADGGIPFVLPDAVHSPRAPWMQPSAEGSFLTFALAAALEEAGASSSWLDRAAGWAWPRLEGPEPLAGYWVKFALTFLDAIPDEERARRAIERLRPAIGADGTIPVPGGTPGEHLSLLTLSERPGTRSRALFTPGQVEGDLDRLEEGQREDGGWDFGWLAWSPGQTVEWRGALTVSALATLRAHGRMGGPSTG